MANISFQTEDNINFYDLLKNDNLNENIIINNDDNSNNICLLTNLPLTLNHVRLPSCKHKFNYLPLLKELLRQKNINNNEIIVNNHYSYGNYSVPNGYTKCPYCRSLNKGCLPYIPELYSNKYNDVNYPPAKGFTLNFCKHTFSNGKRKGLECGRPAYEVEKDIFTCKIHKHKVNPIHKTKKIKIKSIQNTIISTDNLSPNPNTCIVHLKTGKRKGEPCGVKVVDNSTMCLRHTNLSNKNSTN